MGERTYAAMLAMPTVQDRFTAIYRQSLWGSSETVSGPGSEKCYAANLVPALINLFERHDITSIVDAPCGDMNWMVDVLARRKLRYHGFDLVPELVASLKHLETEHLSIGVSDIRSMTFPGADLWLCRDCWFHLSYADIRASLNAFLASTIPYALLTSHINDRTFANTDVRSGDFRLLDLFSPPFSLSDETVDAIDDWIAPWPPRRLYLWRREQLMNVQW